MKRPANFLLLVLGVLIVAVAAYFAVLHEFDAPVDFRQAAVERGTLIAGIQSYTHVTGLESRLKAESWKYTITRSDPPSASDTRPPFDIVTVTVPEFTHLDSIGALFITFFNDRLMGTRFFPVDPERYRTALFERAGVDIRHRDEARLGSFVRVWIATDYTGKVYVGWDDIRLAEEMQRWIKRYS